MGFTLKLDKSEVQPSYEDFRYKCAIAIKDLVLKCA